jgi:hypothetical protein
MRAFADATKYFCSVIRIFYKHTDSDTNNGFRHARVTAGDDVAIIFWFCHKIVFHCVKYILFDANLLLAFVF